MRVRRVGILSCAVVSAILGALYGLFLGLLVYLTSMLPTEAGTGRGAPVVRQAQSSRPGPAGQEPFGELGAAVAALVVLIVSPIAGVVGGFISGALFALVYNATVGLTGGLELDLRERPGPG
jgi:hypothetical protein